MSTLTNQHGTRDSRIPGSERIKRLLRESGHLRALIAGYHCEPRTEQQFIIRNSLIERLRSFDSACRQSDNRSLPPELQQVFSKLQHDTFAYIRDARI